MTTPHDSHPTDQGPTPQPHRPDDPETVAATHELYQGTDPDGDYYDPDPVAVAAALGEKTWPPLTAEEVDQLTAWSKPSTRGGFRVWLEHDTAVGAAAAIVDRRRDALLAKFEALAGEWANDHGIFSPDSKFTRDVLVRELRAVIKEARAAVQADPAPVLVLEEDVAAAVAEVPDAMLDPFTRPHPDCPSREWAHDPHNLRPGHARDGNSFCAGGKPSTRADVEG